MRTFHFNCTRQYRHTDTHKHTGVKASTRWLRGEGGLAGIMLCGCVYFFFCCCLYTDNILPLAAVGLRTGLKERREHNFSHI